MNSIARQPIFDKNFKIYGYELLFRGLAIDETGGFDHDGATSSVLYTGLFSVGLDKLTHGKRAFVNFSRGMLTGDLIQTLPQGQITIEILEHVEPDALVLQTCEELRKKGYQIALDDFSTEFQPELLVPMADIIKVDTLNTSPLLCRDVPKRFAAENRIFLAEKVETYEQYRQAVDWGYTLFQGYFFCRPQRIETHEIQGNKQVCFRLLKAMQDEKVTMDRLEQIIKQDLFLSYGIIKYINSAAIGLRSKVQSLKHALTLLGMKKIKEFSTILLLKRIGDDKPGELVVQSLIRGNFAETLARASGLARKADGAFLTGIFSLMDALLDRSMQAVLTELDLDEEVAAALLNRSGELADVLEAVVSYEKGNWVQYDACMQKFPAVKADVQELYLAAIAWAEDIMTQ